MFARAFMRKSFAGVSARTPTAARFNSTSTTAAGARRVIAQVAEAEKPTALESAVPVMWLLSGAAIVGAWNRIDETKEAREGVVEKLLIV